MNNSRPMVSVVMATFNEPEHFIRESIDSILNQSYSNLELIIIDDSTNYETINAINELSKDSRVVLVRDEERIGFVKALNIGLKKAKGKYIARMDGDDISVNNRLELQIQYLESHSDCSVLGGGLNIIDENGNVTSERSYPLTMFKLKLWSIFRSPVAHPTIMMRKTLIDKGYLYNEEFRKAEDLELWVRMINDNVLFSNLSEKLLNYRVCGDLSNKRTSEHFAYNYKARKNSMSLKSPFYSIFSVLVAILYCLMPISVIQKIYSRENRKG